MFHIHLYRTPVTCKYVSFYTRNIGYKCRCGRVKQKIVTRSFSEPFPIEITE